MEWMSCARRSSKFIKYLLQVCRKFKKNDKTRTNYTFERSWSQTDGATRNKNPKNSLKKHSQILWETILTELNPVGIIAWWSVTFLSLKTFDDFRVDGRPCWTCHREVPHGRMNSLSAAPNALIPETRKPIPDWIKNLVK